MPVVANRTRMVASSTAATSIWPPVWLVENTSSVRASTVTSPVSVCRCAVCNAALKSAIRSANVAFAEVAEASTVTV